MIFIIVDNKLEISQPWQSNHSFFRFQTVSISGSCSKTIPHSHGHAQITKDLSQIQSFHFTEFLRALSAENQSQELEG